MVKHNLSWWFMLCYFLSIPMFFFRITCQTSKYMHTLLQSPRHLVSEGVDKDIVDVVLYYSHMNTFTHMNTRMVVFMKMSSNIIEIIQIFLTFLKKCILFSCFAMVIYGKILFSIVMIYYVITILNNFLLYQMSSNVFKFNFIIHGTI